MMTCTHLITFFSIWQYGLKIYKQKCIEIPEEILYSNGHILTGHLKNQ